MEVRIVTESGTIAVDAEALDAAVFLGNVFGYSLDLEPCGNSYTIAATHWRSTNTIRATGRSIRAVSKKLIELLTEEVKGD